MFKKGKYSDFIRPIAFTLDLSIVYVMAYLILLPYINISSFFIYMFIVWTISSFISEFYIVYRHTHTTNILILLTRQTVLLALVTFAYFGFHKHEWIHASTIIKFVMFSMTGVFIIKFTLLYLLKRYRLHLKGNIKRVVILGDNKNTEQLEYFFTQRQEYGYLLQKVFDMSEIQVSDLEKFYDYVQLNRIDEIYVSLAETSNEIINELVDFVDNNLIELKFLPDNKDIFTRKLNMQYYGLIPIVALRTIPVDKSINKIGKRIFDILFSGLVVLLVLSWLTPLLAIIIKLDSRGPVFFKQKRNGLGHQEFLCYKFRSMTPNKAANVNHATRGDERVTKVGMFLRKTSLDELPQFINVLFGDMSVVGPRPHMISATEEFASSVDKYMVRHFVKPGITGLAQVSGYRGEIETDQDIKNRVKYDIFYIENWSLFLDFKIILLTVYNMIKGEDKAY